MLKRTLIILGLLIALTIALAVPTSAHVQLDPSLDKIEALSSRNEVVEGTAEMQGGSGFTGTGPPPRVSANVQVNDPQQPLPDGLIGRSETSVVAGQGSRQLLAGWNDADGFCALIPDLCSTVPQFGLSGYAFSNDGGETWTDAGAPPLFDNIFTFGDPWLDRGGFDQETYYYANIGADLATGQFGMSIHRGHFDDSGNFAWEDVRFLAPDVPSDFFDKEALAAAKDGSGVVILTLTNFLDLFARDVCPEESPFGFGQIEVFRSADGGDTWQGPAIAGPDLTDTDADPGCNVGTSQQSSSPAFGPNGEVYVVWERGPAFDFASSPPSISAGAEIVMARSFDGGETFEAPVVVAEINHMRGAPPVAYNRNRINSHPRIAVDVAGANRGRIYVVFPSLVDPVSGIPETMPCPEGTPEEITCVAQNTTSSQVYISYSDDQGATWSSPTPLASDLPNTGLKRWWPTVSVAPGGAVDVTYYESQEVGLTPDPDDVECIVGVQGGVLRRGPAVSLVDTMWVRSGDGGTTFNRPVRASEVSTNWCQVATNIIPNMGDYIFSVSGGNQLLSTWADGRNGVPDTFYATGLGTGRSRR